jgi:hypothetical protein
VVFLRKMNIRSLVSLFLFCSASVLAQQPAAPAAHTSELGFSYSLPADWDVVDSQPTLPEVQQKATQNAATEDEKKGIACAKIALTARHADSGSMVVAVALPLDCFGQPLTEKDLPGFAQGASEGLRTSFDLSEPTFGTYSLGSHNMWVERASGSVKDHAEIKYTIEITCGVLKKAAVCWMAIAPSEDALRIFENGAVVLDGESAPALVPANAFEKKPTF